MENLDKCRVCLHEDVGGAVSLMEVTNLYQYVTGFVILDRGPQKLCQGCLEKLQDAFQFKKRCEESEQIIERAWVDIKEEMIDEDDVIHDNLLLIPETESFCEEESVVKEEESKINQYKCPHCNKIHRTYRSCLTHCMLYHPEKRLQCPRSNCTYLYYFPSELEKHIQKTHDSGRSVKRHKCNICDETFSKDSHLRKHRQNVHDKSKEKTLCPHCGKTLKFSSLASHIEMIHEKSDAGVYICDFCGNTYNSKISITNHLRYQHMKKDPIICRYCPETFANDGSRRYHEVTVHTKAYKHVCAICGMRAYNSAIYKRHMLSHTGEKPYMCTTCGARFGRKNTLSNHIATHTDVKAFVCKRCNAAFKTIKSLKTHQNVHEERKYECPVCLQKFLVNQSMRIHCTKTHPEYVLPPPGTVMNKQAIKRMQEMSMKRPQCATVVNSS